LHGVVFDFFGREAVNAALRWTFCGLKPQAQGLIEGASRKSGASAAPD